jgi:hypothetical protein
MGIENLLKIHLENQEPITIIYNGGSQPGSTRELIIKSIKTDSIRAITLGNTLQKEYKIAKIELLNSSSEKIAPIYTEGKQSKVYTNYEDVLKINKELFEEKELVVVLEENSFGLFEKFKNGALKRKPKISIEFNEFVYDDYYDSDKDKFRNGKHKSEKPWCVRCKGENTRNYKHFDKAIETLLLYVRDA